MDKNIFDNCDWQGTSAIISIDEIGKSQLVKLLKISNSDYDYNNNELEIYNHKNILFLDRQFIYSEIEFEDFLKYYIDKDFSNLRYFSRNRFAIYKLNTDLGKDKKIYSSIIENNNIVTDGIVEEKIIIPPTLFDELNNFYKEYEAESVESLNYLRELFSLFLIAEKSKIFVGEESTYFEFTFFCENSKNHVLKILWNEWDSFENNIFFECYKWILSKHEESFKIETVLKVVRQYLGSLNDIESIEDPVASLDSILNRIMLNETKLYFEQQNKLKDEFIDYHKMELDSKSTLMKSLLGLITTVGLAYYGKVILIKNFDFTDKNKGIAIIFIFALFAIIFFIFIFLVNYFERKRYFLSLKKIYVEKFGFSDKDFKSIVTKPSLYRDQWIYWLTLIIFLVIIIILIKIYW